MAVEILRLGRKCPNSARHQSKREMFFCYGEMSSSMERMTGLWGFNKNTELRRVWRMLAQRAKGRKSTVG